jgi:hypothetical protein
MKEIITWISSSAEPKCILWKIHVIPDTVSGMTHEDLKPFLRNPNLYNQETAARGGFT